MNKKSIAFVNFSSLVYDVATPYDTPMGGSESAMCYLAAQMAKDGWKVILFSQINKKYKKLGVDCVPVSDIQNNLKNLNYLVVQNSPLQGWQLKHMKEDSTKLILWTQHDIDQPAVESMNRPEVASAFDGYVLISDWQKENYINKFNLDPKKCTVLRNAISPAFENMFKSEQDVVNSKKRGLMAYTSTPFRGLNLLIQMFPAIVNYNNLAQLKVFSSLQVYHVDPQVDQQGYGALYELCKNTKGVDYVGSVSQKKLASELKKVSILSYPNTFPETSCIAVMEAMASGCFIVTSNLGALPETTAGYGKLIDVDGNWQRYGDTFISEILKFIQFPQKMYDQVKFVNKNYVWTVRSKQWTKWLATIK